MPEFSRRPTEVVILPATKAATVAIKPMGIWHPEAVPEGFMAVTQNGEQVTKASQPVYVPE